MTLNEALEYAEKGDQDAICALGQYYYEEKDYHESLKWYKKGAESGNATCMLITCQLENLLGHVARKIDPNDTERQLERFNSAIFWGTKALENGIEEAEKHINTSKGELGITYYYLASSSDNIDDYLKSISLLKESYSESSDPEIPLFLAFSLFKYLNCTDSKNEDEYSLVANLLLESVTNEDIAFKGIAYAYLGTIFTFGNAGEVDYDKAVKYYTLAGINNFDCSDMLSRFRKKLFGGYTLQ